MSTMVEGPRPKALDLGAASSVNLHEKLDVYRRNGVRDYVAWRVLDRAVTWDALREGRYVPMEPGADGIIRSEVFPGMWLDAAALVNSDYPRVLEVLHQGIASPEHAGFVASLGGGELG